MSVYVEKFLCYNYLNYILMIVSAEREMARVKSVVEFGTSKIICMIENRRGPEAGLPGSSCVRYDGMRKGRFARMGNMAELVDQVVSGAEEKMRAQIRGAYVGVPGCFTRVLVKEGSKHMAGGRVTEEEIQAMARKLMPRLDKAWEPLATLPLFFVDGREELYTGPPIGLRTARLTACFSFLFARKRFLDDIRKIFGDLHIGIDGFVSEIQAQALHYIPGKVRDASVLLLDIGYHHTDVSVIFGDGIMAHRTIFGGGYDIVDELKNVLRIDEALAESLKRMHIFGIGNEYDDRVYGKGSDGKMVSFEARLVSRSVEESAGRLCAQIREVLKEFSGYVSKNTPIYLTGGGIAMHGAETYLSAQLGREVRMVRDGRQKTLPPVYNSAAALLDNRVLTGYHVDRENVSNSLIHRVRNIFSS